jgi:tRNA threonylcarbamoyladenosine biosynthesis protein TsaB
MRILGIETSTPVVSVAVAEDEKVRGEYALTTKQGHMKHLLPLIDSLLTSLDFTLQDIDGYAVAIGPGSFTSLRVGLATCKALAHATGKQVAGVPTLDVLARGLKGRPGLICPVLCARRDEVYTAFYVSSSQGVQCLSSYLAVSPMDLAQRLSRELLANVTFVGDGAQKYWDLLSENLGEQAILADLTLMWPRAGLVTLMGLEAFEKKEGNSPEAVQALYVKPPAIRQHSDGKNS